MKIGSIEFQKYPVFLAPMEDVTDPTFRYMCKLFGVDMMYTEFISAEGLIREGKKGLRKLDLWEAERPIGIQIYGANIEPMVEAAKMVEQAEPEILDLNFGCPVKKIAGRGAGSGMLREVDKMIEMTRRIVDAVKIPVTAKTRIGWNHEEINIQEVTERIQETGIQALTIHGRTKVQMYKGFADWDVISAVKKNPKVKIPIIGNGDIASPEIAKQRFDESGVDAIMVGRGSIGKPWLFKEIRHYLDTGELLAPPTVAERVEMAKIHLEKSIEWKQDYGGVMAMRRHFVHYFKGIPDFKDTRLKLLTTVPVKEVYEVLDYISDRFGHIRPEE
ncbi:MAG: tRNA dihydrouridine synthase DusB [Bacteroidales bacterium]|nr:tRNA dihydrouridine synthase DusB [Bacteroidales bacterium]